MSRRWILGVVAGAVAVVAQAAIVRSPDDEAVDLHLFDDSGTVCDRYEADSFEAQVSELVSTPGRELRLRLTQVRADLVRKFVDRRGTPIVARTSVARLADALDRATRADDFQDALRQARTLDSQLAARCP